MAAASCSALNGARLGHAGVIFGGTGGLTNVLIGGSTVIPPTGSTFDGPRDGPGLVVVASVWGMGGAGKGNDPAANPSDACAGLLG